jgi:acetylglutamate kinase
LAGEIAAAIKAEKLIFLTDVPGVQDKNGKLIPKLNIKQTKELLDSGVAAGGMIPKLNGCLKALEVGTTACIIDGREPGVLRKAVNNNITGTTIQP